MSIPRDHHYLPRFYIERWATEGTVVRYVRPRGVGGHLDRRRKPPSAIAYERDLYHLPDIGDPIESQALELGFFQKIDDRAAVALDKLDRLERGAAADRVALSQFLISLLHRSPSRLAAIRREMAARSADAPYRSLEGAEFDRAVKAMSNRLLASLVESKEGARIVSKFRAFRIDVSASSKRLLTSDRPVNVSGQLIGSDAFLILPYAPYRLLILTHREEIANAFSSQDPTTLVRGINIAVVEQAEDLVIAADENATRMIDKTFLQPRSKAQLDPIGLIRRKSPFIDLHPQSRTFTRHDKIGMRFLGK